MPEHEDVSLEELALIGERELMVRHFRQSFRQEPTKRGGYDLRDIFGRMGLGLFARANRLVGRSRQADFMNNMASAMSQAAAELDTEKWEGGKSVIPPVIRRGVRGAATIMPEMVVAGAAAGPYGAIGAAVTQEMDQAVTEGKAAGLKGAELARFVGAQGVVEAVPAAVMQKFGMGGFEAVVGRQGAQASARGVLDALKRAGYATLQEVPEELITELGHANVETKIEPGAMSLEALYRRGVDTVVQTLAMMGMAETPHIAQSWLDSGRDTVQQAQKDAKSVVSKLEAGKAPSAGEMNRLGMGGGNRAQRTTNATNNQEFLTELANTTDPEGFLRGVAEYGTEPLEESAGTVPPAVGPAPTIQPGAPPVGDTGAPIEPTVGEQAPPVPPPAAEPEGRAGVIAEAARLQLEAGKKLPSRNEMERILGETVTEEQAAEFLQRLGLDEITAASEAMDMAERYGGAIPTRTLVVSSRSILSEHDREGRLREMMAEVGDATVIEFTKEGSDVKYTVHPSTYEQGKWQITRTDEMGASGHQTHATKEEAVGAAIGAHPSSYWDEGDADYKINRKLGGTQPPAEPRSVSEPPLPPTPPEDVGHVPESTPEITSIKNWFMNQFREERGLGALVNFPKETFQEWLDDAGARMSADPNWIPNLVHTLNIEPRAVDEREHAGLQIHYRQKVNELAQYTEQLKAAQAAGDTVAASQASILTQKTLAELATIEKASKGAGWIAGKSLAARKIELAEDFSLANLVREATGDFKGNPLPEEVVSYLKDLEARVAAKEAEIVQVREELANARAQESVSKAVREVEEETLDEIPWSKQDINDLRKRAEFYGIVTANRKRPRLVRMINKVENDIRQTAEAQDIPFRVLVELAREVSPETRDRAARERKLQEIALDALGFSQTMDRFGNRKDLTLEEKLAAFREQTEGRDYTSRNITGFEHVAEKYLGDEFSDIIIPFEDPGAQLWDLLQQDIPTETTLNSPEILDAAVQRFNAVPEWQNATEADFPRQPWESVPQRYEGETPETPTAPRKPTRKQRKEKAQTRVNAATAKFMETLGEYGKVGAIYDPQRQAEQDIRLFNDAFEVVKAYADLGYSSFLEFWADFKATVNQNMSQVKQAFNDAWRAAIDQGLVTPHTVDLENASSVTKVAASLVRAAVEDGITDFHEVAGLVHEELKQIEGLEDMTFRQAVDAIGGYGQYKQLPKDDVSTRAREIRGEAQQISKLDDLAGGIWPMLTGQERRAPSDYERRMIAQVNELKKDPQFRDMLEQAQAGRARGTLQAMKKAMEHRIADLKWEIQNRERIVREKRESPTDEELNRLRQQRDELLKEHREIFGKPGMSEEARLKAAEKAAERAFEQLRADMRAGNFGPKAQAPKLSSPRLDYIRARMDAWRAARDEIRAALNPGLTPLEKATKAYKRSLLKRLADYRQDILEENFGPKEKTQYEYPPEVQRLKVDLEEIKAEYRMKREQWQAQNWTTREKIVNWGGEALNASRSIITAFDFGAVLRQGGLFAFAHPIQTAKQLPDMVAVTIGKDALKFGEMNKLAQRRYLEKAEELKNREGYVLSQQAGLELTEIGGPMTQMEEAYKSRLARMIPGVFASERAYVYLLNRQRMDMFESFIASLGREGKVTLDEAKHIAEFVNIYTGRGSLGVFAKHADFLSTAFFSPRYVLSRFQLLTGKPFRSKYGTWRTRKLIAKEMGRTMAGLTLFYSTMAFAAFAFFDDDDEDRPQIEMDPRSSDFGKVKFGNTRVDPLSGLSQTAVYLTRTIWGESKSTRTGEIKNLIDPEYGQQSWTGVQLRFWQSKLAPWLSAGIEFRTGKDVIGQDVTKRETALEMVIPLVARDGYESMKEQGIPAGTALTVLAIMGMGIQNYEGFQPKSTGSSTRRTRTRRRRSRRRYSPF